MEPEILAIILEVWMYSPVFLLDAGTESSTVAALRPAVLVAERLRAQDL
jgi:hypothetical protein